MPPRQKREPEEPLPKPRTATTPRGRENQLIDLADRLAEKQLRDGTASAQVISHFLKLGSSRERLEQKRIELENELTQKKTEAMASASRVEELITGAIAAFKSYSGGESTEHYDDYPQDPELY